MLHKMQWMLLEPSVPLIPSTSIRIAIVLSDIFLTIKSKDASGYSNVVKSIISLSIKILPFKSSILKLITSEAFIVEADSSFEQENKIKFNINIRQL